VQDARRADPLVSTVMLVGSRLLGDYLGWRLVELGQDCFNIRFITFADLSRDLSLDARLADARPEVPSMGELAAAEAAVEALRGEHVFSRISHLSGFRRALAASFSDLDEAGIELIDRAVRPSRDERNKLATLARLRGDFVERLKPFRRPIDDLTPPPEPGAAFRRAYGTDRLTIYGIYDFTAVQRRLLEELAGAVEMRVFFPYWSVGDEYGTAFAYAKPALRFFQRIGGKSGISTSRNPALYITSDSGRHLFCYKPVSAEEEAVPLASRLVIFRAHDPAVEVDGIVGRINELALWKGVPLSRIGVLLWHPDRYLEPLKSALDRAGLPYADIIGISLDRSPEGRALLGLMELAGDKLHRRALIDLITSHELKLETDNGLEPPDPVAWETISIHCGIIEGDRHRWLEALQALQDTIADQTGRADIPVGQPSDEWRRGNRSHLVTTDQVSTFRKLLERLFDRLDDLPAEGRWSDFSAATTGLVDAFLPECDRTARILELLRELAGLDGLGGQATREQFIRTVAAAMGRVRTGRGRFRTDGITICDKMIARGVGFDALFIPGLAQGSVPVSPREDAILTDSDRGGLNRIFAPEGEPLLPLKSDRLEEERLLFALAVDAARELLALSYPSQEEGDKKLPSRFLIEVCRIQTGHPIEAERISELPFFEDDASDPAPDLLTRRTTDPKRYPINWVMAHITGDNRRAQAFQALYTGRSARFDRTLEARRARHAGKTFTPWDGVMPAGWRRGDADEKEYAVTSLELYAECPFKFLMNNVLQARPVEEPESLLEVPPAVVGSVIHRALHRFYNRAAEQGRIPLTPADEDWARDAITEILHRVLIRVREENPAPEVVWNIQSRMCDARLKRFITHMCRQTAPFSFRAAEESIEGPFTFELPDGSPFTIRLKGKFDRLDTSPDGRQLRVIDYKTGKERSGEIGFKGGRQLQLAIYLKGLLDKSPDADPATSLAQYLSIDSAGNIKEATLEGAKLSERAQELGLIVKAITDGIESGLFPPLEDEKNCRYCDFQLACDQRSRHSLPFRQGDPRLAELMKARDIR